VRKHESKIGIEPEKRSLRQLFDSGLVFLDKPRGPSSHEVSSFVKKMLDIPKAGHSGTLDPNVSGVLPVMLGNATKLAPLLLGSPKEYVCVMALEGEASDKELDEALSHFYGKIYQTPPLESAVKKALRIREIYSLKLLERKGNLVLFDSRVQGGTYIRTLVKDIGLLLGMTATMAELRRTVAAGIKEGQCVTLQELSDRLWLAAERGDEKPLRKCIVPVEDVVKLKRITVDDESLKPLCTGANLGYASIVSYDDSIEPGQTIGLFTGKGELACIAKAMVDGKKISSAIQAGERGLAADVVRVVRSYGA
jgi:H/ACA ribonucleoprotein complex subunit 4